MSSRSRRPLLSSLLAATLILLPPIAALLVSCAAQATAPQEWSKKHGPLVPHRTFPGDCQTCHTTAGWRPLRDDFHFDHEKQAHYRLEGAHANAQCLRCHNDRGPVQKFLARGCSGCHVDPHEGELGTTCDSCHNQIDWQPRGMIAEHARTRFPLIGTHLALPCDQCHERARVGNFEGAPMQCEVCHARDLARATDPDHQGLGWTSDCQRCHTPTTFSAAHFAHTTFALVGQHRQVDCKQCHQSGFTGTPRDCYTCHAADYTRSKDPDHVASGFPTTCEQCHTPFGWDGANFKHDKWKLTGQHLGVDCQKCHTNGYSGTPTDCYSCHTDDYARAKDPDHVAGGFPTTCEQCHTTSGWDGANFKHDKWPLTGAHVNTACQKCHASGYSGTPRDCYACHADDYAGAKDPDHVANGYPTTCEQCHGTSSWDDAHFDHESYFPIAKGNHKLDCNLCHTTGSTATFSCIDCHAHNKSDMDREHRERKDYRYESQACYQCHPRGKAD